MQITTFKIIFIVVKSSSCQMYKALIVMICGIDPDVKHLVFISIVQKIKYVYPLAAMLFGKDTLAVPYGQVKTIW